MIARNREFTTYTGELGGRLSPLFDRD